ncbi:hypothetical protein BDW66DRAFT_13402 [Aspergillus desertorum]
MSYPQDRYNHDYSNQNRFRTPLRANRTNGRSPHERNPESMHSYSWFRNENQSREMDTPKPTEGSDTAASKDANRDGTDYTWNEVTEVGSANDGQTRVSRYFSSVLQSEYSRGLEDYLRFPDS